MAKLKITLKHSPIGHSESQKRTVRALGLRKLHQSVLHEDTPSIRGMIAKIVHLVQVEVVDGEQEPESSKRASQTSPKEEASQPAVSTPSAEAVEAETTEQESQEVSS